MSPWTTVSWPALVIAVNERAPKDSASPRSTVACAARALPENESVTSIVSRSSPIAGGPTERERVAPAWCLKSFM